MAEYLGEHGFGRLKGKPLALTRLRADDGEHGHLTPQNSNKIKGLRAS